MRLIVEEGKISMRLSSGSHYKERKLTNAKFSIKQDLNEDDGIKEEDIRLSFSASYHL